MALVFADMNVHTVFIYLFIFITSDHSLIYSFFNLVLMNRQNGPQYQRVLALCTFFNRGNTEGTNSSKILCLTFVCVLLFVHLFQD